MYAVGDERETYCLECGKFVKSTVRCRDVPFQSGLGIVKEILVFVCNDCDTVCAIPSQSTPAIAAARRELLSSQGTPSH